MASVRPRWIVPAATAAATLLGFELLAALATLPSALEAFAHDWLFSFLPLFGAAMCAARGIRVPAERLPWTALAVAMVGWSAADAYYVWSILRQPAPPYPSWTDAGWIPFYPACLLAVLALLRSVSKRPTAAVALDTACAGFASGALLVALVGPWLAGSVAGGVVADAVTLAYPVFDVLLLALVMAAFVTTGWRPGLQWTLLAGALALRVTEDAGWLQMVTHGGYEHGTVMDVMCPASMVLIGVAAWTPARQPRAVTTNGVHVLVVPAAATLVSLALLAAAGPLHLPLVATLLAVGAILAVVARMTVTYGELRDLAASREEALTDDLTGLPNRRRLMRDLERAIASGEEHALALFDLDGFKRYNDLLGHPAGDALLALLGRRLQRAMGHGDAAYRLGGDEFCVLARGDGDAAITAARAALTTTANGAEITTSLGIARLPDEASDVTYALQLADERMFLVKESGRAPWERQVRDLLLGMVAEQQPELHQHSGEVAEHVRAVGRRLGLAHVELQQAVWAAELHDVGKCAIPREILDKPGPLDLSEWAIMRTHTVVGERMLARAPAMAGVAALVRSSHERWDGRGYPDELAAEAIPLGARVIAACDAYDAMRSDRPYQRARSHEDAIAELRRGAGSQFDPAVVDALEATLSPGFQAALAPAEPRRRPGSAQRADVTT